MTTMNFDAPLECLRQTVEAATEAPTVIGPLRPTSSVSLVAAGGDVRADLAGNVYARPLIHVNAKQENQAEALQLLEAALAALQWYSKDAEDWQLTGVSIRRAPTYMGMNAQNEYIYSASITARIFLRREV